MSLPPSPSLATIVLFRDGTIAEATGFAEDLRGHDLRELPLSSGPLRVLGERLGERGAYQIDDAEARPPVRLTVLVIDALPIRISLVSVRELLLRTMDVFAAQARSAAVELVIECGPETPPALHGDSEKLAWLLATLVGNAVRLVRGAAEVEPRVVLRATFDAATSDIVFVVTDNGPGMPEEVARWLFERDPSTGRPAGLALAMARDVVRAHSGSISVESHVGKGASFRVAIPRAGEATR
jgi:signal transduction histidine kinase